MLLVNTTVDTSTDSTDIEAFLDNILTENSEINSTSDNPPPNTKPEVNLTLNNSPLKIEPETEVFQKVQDKLTQPLIPLLHNHPNSFISRI